MRIGVELGPIIRPLYLILYLKCGYQRIIGLLDPTYSRIKGGELREGGGEEDWSAEKLT